MNNPVTQPFSTVDKPLLFKGLALLIVIAAFFALWRWTPLKEWATPENIKTIATQLGQHPFAPLIFFAAYLISAVTFFPRPLITMAAVIAFGAWLGFFYAMVGIIIASVITYAAGAFVNKRTINHIAGNKLNHVIAKLQKANFLIVSAVRLVPIAPFIVINLIAGAIRINLSHFITGTAIGMMPGALIATVFANQFNTYIHDSGELNYTAIIGVLIIWVAIGFGVKRWWIKQA